MQLENVFAERVSFRPDPEKESFFLDFRQMEEDKYVKNMQLKDVHLENVQHIGVLSRAFELVTENLVTDTLRQEPYVLAPDSQVDITEK